MRILQKNLFLSFFLLFFSVFFCLPALVQAAGESCYLHGFQKKTMEYRCYESETPCIEAREKDPQKSITCRDKEDIKSDPDAGAPEGIPFVSGFESDSDIDDPDEMTCYKHLFHEEKGGNPYICRETAEKCNEARSADDYDYKMTSCTSRSKLPEDIKTQEMCYNAVNSIQRASTVCKESLAACKIAHKADPNHIGPCLTKENAQNKAYHHNSLLAKKNTMKYTHQGVVVNDDPDALVPCKNGCNFDQLMILIKRVVNFLIMIIAAPFATIFMVYAGFLYMTSMGNPSKIKQAKDIFFWIVIGFVIALSAWLVVNALLLGLGVTGAFNLLG